MSALRHGAFRFSSRAAAAVFIAACLIPAAASTHKPKSDPWLAAVEARTQFEAVHTHTRADYTQVLDNFRAIYHADPGDAHAAAAVDQVAELLAEQGHELDDAKSLHDAAAQYAFLIKAYPQSSYAARARHQHLEVETAATAPPKTATPKLHPPLIVGEDGEPKPLARASAKTVAEAAETSPATPASTSPRALVSGIRHWSTSTYTRVAIDLGDDVQYQAARVENPDRIFFDLHHAKLAPELAGKSFAVTDDGFLTRIRAAQYSDDVTRVVLDVHEVTEYSAFLLPNPYRLIIDIHGKPLASPASSTPAAIAAPESPYVTQVSAEPAPVTRESPHTAASILPPMPVTDGSASFGLPAKSSDSTAAVSQPRVVIPTRSTAAKPVPNTITSHSTETTNEVAAVSSQPGKVEATHHPTSAPIAERSHKTSRLSAFAPPTEEVEQPYVAAAPPALAASAEAKSHRNSKATIATPTSAPPPTADGETSLLRVLGLKIGRIVIDAGHGGHDSGTLGVDGIEEKDVVLDVALRLGKLLHDKLGAEIVYTRADDTFIPLETRTAIANKAQADLFISIHANSSQDATARGVEVYYLNFTSDPGAMQVASRENAVSTQSVHELSDLVKKIALKDKIDESRELASDVDEALYAGLEKGNDGLKDRGIKKAPFVVLIGANMPSILAEISFVTNPRDAEQLATPEYRQRVAESLFHGVARYASAINGAKTPAPAPVQRAKK